MGKTSNRSFDADAQVHPCAVRTRLMCAGQLRRYASYLLRYVDAHAGIHQCDSSRVAWTS